MLRRCGRSLIGLVLGWALLLVLAEPLLAAPRIAGPWRVCDAPPWTSSSTCAVRPIREVDPQGRMLWLTADVRVDATAGEPAAVFVSAVASSAIYWDGKLVGTNGRPAARRELERPGFRDAAILLPPSAPGIHKLTLQMSSHHGILRLDSPVRQVRIAPYEGPLEPVLRGYLPALTTAGGLLIAAIFFGFASWAEGRRASRIYLTGAALFATGQLGAEASRAFIQYAYPANVLRICLVLAFAAGFGFMLLAYLARRFEAPNRLLVLLIQAVVVGTVIVAVPGFDQRTWLVLMSAAAIGMLLAIQGARQAMPGALPIFFALAVGVLLSLLSPYSFLDRDLYLWIFGLFVLLFADEARRLKQAQRSKSEGPDEPKNFGVPDGISLGTAAGRHFVLANDIVRLAAADDYTEAFLTDGRTVLHPEPLQRLLERLPASFLRVHRSHAINLAHLRSFRKGSSSSVVLSDDSTAPVSRRSVAKLVAALGT